MKIGFVHLNLSVESGDPRMFYYIAQNVKKLGYDVKIYTAQFDPKCFPELHAGLDVTVVPPKEALDAQTEITGIIPKIKDRLSRDRRYNEAAMGILAKLPEDLDVLVCQNDASYRLGIFYKKRNPRAKVVWIMNNAPFRHTKKDNPVVNLLSIIAAFREKARVRRFLRGIDVVIVHDREQQELLRPFGREARILYIPVDFEKFYAPPKTIAPGGEIFLLGIGALSPARKFEDIIAAAGVLRKKGRNARVILVCKDSWRDVAYRELLEKTARASGMEGQVDFLFGGASEEELQAILKKSHFYVFPNDIRIWSMSSFEAMAAGLALIVSDVTSVAEALIDGENSLFVRPGYPEEIAEQIDKLIKNPPLYKRITEAGQRFVKENLNWAEYAKNFIALISEARQN
jgi:glycosyltransferase involved in cell wall biosynthesis